ncbi:cutinase family protein [Mycolicibacterium sp. P9-64]|uniref:cutinase family protein n=1 Tax=Mycolicibacterium sp. P9-64 TaxID=2024612 RepID=UPI0011EF9799|nr:cutinase family protein [Mycolicibacterium sp. P9-64]KAA0080135.1 cutinase family protein [Mycolicibacterium sp. P9-64]
MSIHRVHSCRTVGARAGLRWAGLGASALLALSAPLVIPETAAVASADDCPDAEVVFARGTDEPPGMGRVGDALVDSLRQQADGLNIRAYAVNYKATITQRHGGDGAKDAISHIKSTASSCPNTKIVLGGYSQGASVVNIVAGFDGINWGDPLPPEYVKNIAAVATLGNVADRTDGPPPTQNSPLSAKAIDLCNPSDPICHSGPGNAWSGHTQGYVPEYTDEAAAFIAAALLAGSAQSSVPGYGSQSPVYGPPPGPVYGPPPGPQSGYGLQPPDSVPSAPSLSQLPTDGSQLPTSAHGDASTPTSPGPGLA